MALLVPAVLIALAIPLVVSMMRANELFVLRARRGKLRVVRGRIPQRLLDDIDDVLARAKIQELELKAVVEDGRPKLHVPGSRLDPGVRQQLRNTIGLWQVPAIRNAPKRLS